MKNLTNNEKREEAIARLRSLSKKLKIQNEILEEFKKGNITISYISISDGANIAVINENHYIDVIKKFEQKYNCLVYHAIETNNILSLLFVSNCKENWIEERLYKNKYILAYVINFEYPDCSEIGDILISCENGALIRTDILF